MPFIIPAIGGRSVERVKENCKDVSLTNEELINIIDILDSFPVVGQRYPPAAATLNDYRECHLRCCDPGFRQVQARSSWSFLGWSRLLR